MEKTDTVTLPEYAVTYLEYGEQDQLNAEDIKNIENWLKRYNNPIFQYEEGSYFSKFPAFGLACTCIDCNVFEAI